MVKASLIADLSLSTGYPTSALTGLGAGVATWLGAPTAANLLAATLANTGTGNLVFATSPTLTTPVIGAATGTSLSVTGQLTSTVSTGTAPLVVSSTTNVPNLNASSLNGATFAAPGAIGSTTSSTGAFTALSATGQITSTLAQGTAPLVVTSGTQVANMNVAWSGTSTAANNLTGGAAGSIPYQTGAAVTAMLAAGTNGNVLTLVAGVPAWVAPTSGFANPMTTTGDIIYSSSGSTPARLGIGGTNQVLTVVGGVPTWQNASGGFANPMSANGDIIIGGTSGTALRLAAGTTGQVLTISGTNPNPTWSTITGLTVSQGGTGLGSLTLNGIVFGNGTSAAGVTATAGAADQSWSNQILTVTNAGVPIWSTAMDGGTF